MRFKRRGMSIPTALPTLLSDLTGSALAVDFSLEGQPNASVPIGTRLSLVHAAALALRATGSATPASPPIRRASCAG